MTGLNSFARAQAVKKLTSDFIAEHGDFGLERIEAGDIEFGRLLENVASLPFLASRRMIVLSEPSANKALNENPEQLLDAAAETTDLIIIEPKFDKRSSLYKTLKKGTDFREFNELDERQLASWLVDKAKAEKGKLSMSDAIYLVQRAGNNQMGLSNELEKLLIHNPEIKREDIDLLVEPLPQSSVFDLLDAAFAGKHKLALELYQDQRRQRVEPPVIMGMIAWQLHILAVVKANQKLSIDEIARDFKLNPYVVRKTSSIAQKLTLQAVKDLVKRTLDLDIRLKTKPINADDALQHLLLSLG